MRAERVGVGVRRRPFDVQLELNEQRQVNYSKHPTDVPSLLSRLNNNLIFALFNILIALFNIF